MANVFFRQNKMDIADSLYEQVNSWKAGIRSGMHPANERHRYIVTTSYWLDAHLDWSLKGLWNWHISFFNTLWLIQINIVFLKIAFFIYCKKLITFELDILHIGYVIDLYYS